MHIILRVNLNQLALQVEQLQLEYVRDAHSNH